LCIEFLSVNGDKNEYFTARNGLTEPFATEFATVLLVWSSVGLRRLAYQAVFQLYTIAIHIFTNQTRTHNQQTLGQTLAAAGLHLHFAESVRKGSVHPVLRVAMFQGHGVGKGSPCLFGEIKITGIQVLLDLLE
jgi:hypothetical protein